MLLRIRQLPQPQQSTFDSHTNTHAHKHGTVTSTTARRPNNHNHKCLQLSANLSHTRMCTCAHTQAVHMRRRAWHKLRKKRRNGTYGTDKSEISVFIFVCIYTAGSGSTHTSTRSAHIPPSLLVIFSFDAVIINFGEGKTKRTSQISLLDIYFLFLAFFILSLGWDIFAVPSAPSFSFLFTKYGSRVQV